MSFETEPFLLKSFRWTERDGKSGLSLDNGDFIEMPSPEVGSVVHQLLDLTQNSRGKPSFQQLALQLSRWGFPFRSCIKRLRHSAVIGSSRTVPHIG